MKLTEKIDLYLNEEDQQDALNKVLDNFGLPPQKTKIYYHYKKNGYELMVVKFKNKFFASEIGPNPQIWEGGLKDIKKQIKDDTGVSI